ncbi:hypothetical protein ACN4EK_14580 [Pantanalinema rosaneae CENA516]|uniref:hypothetical protein n=1 Tax=Pantanalinema rosaneae TaxID=1620701 RepID=UPI003D6E5DB4
MTIVLCPGIHDPTFTSAFLAGLTSQLPPHTTWRTTPLIVPTQTTPAFSSPHILAFLHDRASVATHGVRQHLPLVIISFSAGVVGAIGAAWGWQAIGGQVKALIAIDGWGVLLAGQFPIHRFSHDHFTHWSSNLLGQSTGVSFYADPAIEHLELWRSPQTALGWQLSPKQSRYPGQTTAAQLLISLLHDYGELSDISL